MATVDILKIIREQITAGIQVDREENDRIAVYTPFMYQDGDHCSFSVVHDPARSAWHLTDEGDVLTHASYSGINLLSKDRISSFRQTIKFYGIKERRGELFFPVSGEAFGEAIFSFSQACLDIVQLTKMPAERKERNTLDLREELRQLVAEVVPAARVDEKWYDDANDQEHVYPVDLRIQGKEAPLYIYAAVNDRHCLASAVSCLHHRFKSQLAFTSVAVFGDEELISRSARIPLLEAVTTHFSSKTDVDKIREFLLQNVA